MYLVDTSVWIDYLRKNDNSAVRHFQNLLDDGAPFGLTGLIYQEILQGAATKPDFDRLVEYLSTQRFYDVLDNMATYQAAAELYFCCRRKGITIRSTVDCLIAQVAIENELTLLHNDEDYSRIASVTQSLKLYPVKNKVVEYKVHEK